MSSPNEQDAQFARDQLATGCRTMERLLLGLLDSKGRVAEEVHAIRKLGKSLRGGFALFRLGKSSAKEIQAIGRLLSEPRDAVSRLSTWHKVAWDEDREAAAAIVGLLNQQTHSAARRPPAETIDWCLARVTAARKNVEELPAANLAKRMAEGMKSLAKRVAKRCRNLDRCGEEDFHDARKALKAYLGARGFLPNGAVAQDPEMIKLAEVLGDENDLSTLSAWLEAHGFTEHFAPSLWQKLSGMRKKLQKRAIEDASQVISAAD